MPIMNSIIDILFVDFHRGEGLVLISEDPSPTNSLKTRLDVIWKDDPPWVVSGTQPIVSYSTLLKGISSKIPTKTRVNIYQIRSIQVMPSYPFPTLFAELKVKEIFGGPDALNSNGETDYASGMDEIISDNTYSLCGMLEKKAWSLYPCEKDLWDEAERGHIIWLRNDADPHSFVVNTFAVVPGGSLLATGRGDVRVLTLGNYGQGKAVLQFSLPFQATSWSLTAGGCMKLICIDFGCFFVVFSLILLVFHRYTSYNPSTGFLHVDHDLGAKNTQNLSSWQHYKLPIQRNQGVYE